MVLAACVTAPRQAPETASLILRPASFGDLPGWEQDRQAEALTAFAQSCGALMKQSSISPSFNDAPMSTANWQAACRALPANADDVAARHYFEQWFVPWQASGDGETHGLFTGYYEAALRGSRQRHGVYQIPLRLRPADLVMVELGDFRPELKGQRIAGSVINGHLKPYADRQAIEAGKLANDAQLQFVWVDDPVDAFFLQIQGSGTIALDDGTSLRVGYDAQNGWPYTAIGRALIERGDLPRDQVSMQSIRAWLKSHPQEAQQVMNFDRSYIFFKILGVNAPAGAEGVTLTPGRSLAVDHARLSYGVPIFVAAVAPTPDQPPFRRLMVAQDTGGAIRGPVRGDVFWGAGAQAEAVAGAMKADGQAWLLLPRGVTPSP